MHFAEAIAIFISGKLAGPMVDKFMSLAPGGVAVVDLILIGAALNVGVTPVEIKEIVCQQWHKLITTSGVPPLPRSELE